MVVLDRLNCRFNSASEVGFFSCTRDSKPFWKPALILISSMTSGVAEAIDGALQKIHALKKRSEILISKSNIIFRH